MTEDQAIRENRLLILKQLRQLFYMSRTSPYTMKKFIILDRDGVINLESVEYIKSPEEWHPIPGSLAAIAALNQAGYEVLIVTNQSGIGRGYYNLATLEKIMKR